MEAFGGDFTPTFRPVWRPENLPSTPDMLSDVINSHTSNSLTNLPPTAIQILTCMYVFDSNQRELVGVDDVDSIMDIVNGLMPSLPDKEHVETRNTVDGLTCMHTVQQEMLHESMAGGAGSIRNGEQILLTMDILLSAHRSLMQGLHPDAGQLRSSITRTATDNGFYEYVKPDNVPSELQSLIDQHNFMVQNRLDSSDASGFAQMLFNLTAHTVLRFLTIHPFADGNGRLARLLASYILTPILPFPVKITPPYLAQEQYIHAIHSARIIDSGSTQFAYPCDLAAMIIEGAWFSIKDASHVLAHVRSVSRGELFVSEPSVNIDRYKQLQCIELTAEEQQREMEILQIAATQLYDAGSGDICVTLLRNTTCKLTRHI